MRAEQMNSPKRHHTLQEFYLRNFCKSGELWVYDIHRDEVRPQTPKNTTVRKHFYTFEDEHGNKDYTIENILAQVEGIASKVIKLLLSSNVLSPSDRLELAMFASIMMHRIPYHLESSASLHGDLLKDMTVRLGKDKNQLEELISSFEQETGNRIDSNIEKLADFMKSGQYEIEIDKRFVLGEMLSTSLAVAKAFAGLDWKIIRATPKKSFITTDNPVIVLSPRDFDVSGFYGLGILTKGAEKYFPLSKDLCLVMLGPGEGISFLEGSTELVRTINLRLASLANSYLIGRSPQLLESIAKKLQLAGRKLPPKFERI